MQGNAIQPYQQVATLHVATADLHLIAGELDAYLRCSQDR